MEGANGECSCGGSWEDELLAEDEVFPKRNNEEHAKVAACKRQRKKLAKVARWRAK